jgi:alpha-tubulin suppressor-like RCC1 family protein
MVTVSAGSTHTCAVDRAGVGLCWGSNTYGQLGDGRLRTENNPPRLVRGNHVFRHLSAGSSHTCGTTQDDRIYCWGINDHGQIGNDTTLIGEFPVLVNGA